MAQELYISKITLPSGNSYDVKDAWARDQINNGVGFTIAWNGAAAPDVSKIPAGVVVKYNGTEYTGTMAASTAETGTFYLVKSSTQVETLDVYDEYIVVGSPAAWEKIGDTQFDFSSLGDLATKSTVTLDKGDGVNVLGTSTSFSAAASDVTITLAAANKDSVLGADTTFTAADSNVSFSGGSTADVLTTAATFAGADSAVSFAAHTTKSVLSANATFTTTVTPTTDRIAASASGAAVGADGTASVLTSLGTFDNANFLTSVTVDKPHMVRTSITPVDGTESVSLVSASDSKLETTSIPNVTSAGSASNWTFTMDSNDAECLVIGGGNGTAATLGTPKTVATGSLDANDANGAAIVSGVTITPKTVAKAASAAINVATGSLANDGTGDVIVNDISTANSAALTAIGTDAAAPQTATVLTGVQVTAQPTIAITGGQASGVGVAVATGITSASTTVASGVTPETVITALGAGTAAGQTVSATNIGTGGAGKATAITGVGTATAAGQAITVGTNDRVDAVISIPTGSAAAQTITTGSDDLVKVADYGDLGVTVA